MNAYEEMEMLNAMQEYIESELDLMGFCSQERLENIVLLSGGENKDGN